MLMELQRGLRFTLFAMVLLGGVYHAVLWGIGRVAFPAQAEGSLLRRADGAVLGSVLIAQGFDGRAYVHPRPSAVGYDAGAAGASNLATSNPEHLRAVEDRLTTFTVEEQVRRADVPSEMVTASGSGLDPHVSPAAAALQAPRIAAARGVDVTRVLELVRAHIERPALGVFGRARVNVLTVNLALDAALGTPSPARKE